MTGWDKVLSNSIMNRILRSVSGIFMSDSSQVIVLTKRYQFEMGLYFRISNKQLRQNNQVSFGDTKWVNKINKKIANKKIANKKIKNKYIQTFYIYRLIIRLISLRANTSVKGVALDIVGQYPSLKFVMQRFSVCLDSVVPSCCHDNLIKFKTNYIYWEIPQKTSRWFQIW